MNILHHETYSISSSEEDVRLLSALLKTEGGRLPVEASGLEQTLDALVTKPWGYEYRVYADAFYDLWHLRLQPGQSTSLHCHPRKVTALICLRGEANIHLLGQRQQVNAPTCLYLGKGVFHATENSGTSELDLIEVEVPRNKLDLLRARDRYGRTRQGYEQPEPQHPLPAMQPAAHREGARLRTRSLDLQYRFAVMSAHEIARHPQAHHLLCISLGIAAALQHSIEVFAGPLPPQAPQGSYFTIALIGEEREAVSA